MYWVFFFFFKQKTAYELRISDWSSDVCSADLASDQVGKLAGQAIAGMDGVADVRPVEARDDQAVTRDAELDEDVVAGVMVCGGGQREAGNVRKFVQQRAQQAIVRAEIMAPFGNAMRLVNREEGDLRGDRKSTRLNSSH